MEYINQTVTEGVNNKQSIFAILSADAKLDDLVCEKTVYNYIHDNRLTAKEHQLRMYPSLKHEKAKYKEPIRVKNLKEYVSRTYEDFINFVNKHQTYNVVQFDTIVGKRTDKFAILTITLVKEQFQFGLKVKKGSAYDVLKKLRELFELLGYELTSKVFAICLCDNGSEFARFYEIEKFNERSEDVRNEFTTAEKLLALFGPIMQFCIHTGMLLLCFFGSMVIVKTGNNPVPELTTGQLSSLTTYGIQILSALNMLSLIFVVITLSREAGNRIVEVLKYEPTLDLNEDGLKTIADGSVDFDHVSFRYSKTAKRNALEDIDLHIKSGETIGIIGGTGSSKSTLIQLISRLYDTTEGTVSVGGVNVRDYNLKSLRDAVAVVLQKNILFSGTIIENMRWGNEKASEEEIREACVAACADDFIQSFPDGYQTYIEQGGTNVSGGQKQRLCIARALLKKPKVLILDDSTSAVDTRTDAMIRHSFKNMIPGTTKIIIAQRVASVEDADRILVLDGGKIAEQGTSEELIALNGIYAEIYHAQTKGKEA
ncbi:MAG: ATP-binding cassette domain-containing protein [Erysipelotrichaceae bacterium]|nr:ATP-binding cassette domain-containing protein [Erysipelotrichaceae bacterium]